MAKTERLTFAYLLCTEGGKFDCGKQLLRVFRTLTAALTHFERNRGGRKMVPCDEGSKRIAQQIDETTGQYWYVEKHIMCDE